MYWRRFWLVVLMLKRCCACEWCSLQKRLEHIFISIISDSLMTKAARFAGSLNWFCVVCVAERKVMMLLENRRISIVGARSVISLMQQYSVVARVVARGRYQGFTTPRKSTRFVPLLIELLQQMIYVRLCKSARTDYYSEMRHLPISPYPAERISRVWNSAGEAYVFCLVRRRAAFELLILLDRKWRVVHHIQYQKIANQNYHRS